jgi:hypothetical protein
MDILSFAGWLYAANRRKPLRIIETDRLPSTSASSSVGRLLLALVIVAVIVGVLGHAADNAASHVVASTTQPSHLGEPE